MSENGDFQRRFESMIKQLILGTAQLGFDYGINNPEGIIPENEAFSILDLAYQKNITVLDSAIGYGAAHSVIGKYHQQNEHKFKVITKFHMESDDPGQLESIIDKEINVLDVECLHGILFHNSADFLSQQKNFEKLKDLKTDGKIGNVGVSLYSNEDFEQVIDKEGIDIIQFPFNVLDNFARRGLIIRKAKERGIELHNRSTYLQGIFFMDSRELTGNLVDLRKSIITLQELACKYQIELQQLLMAYVCSIVEIDGVIIGVNNADQLMENINCFNHSINDEKLFEEIERIQVDSSLLNPSNWKP